MTVKQVTNLALAAVAYSVLLGLVAALNESGLLMALATQLLIFGVAVGLVALVKKTLGPKEVAVAPADDVPPVSSTEMVGPYVYISKDRQVFHGATIEEMVNKIPDAKLREEVRLSYKQEEWDEDDD